MPSINRDMHDDFTPAELLTIGRLVRRQAEAAIGARATRMEVALITGSGVPTSLVGQKAFLDEMSTWCAAWLNKTPPPASVCSSSGRRGR